MKTISISRLRSEASARQAQWVAAVKNFARSGSLNLDDTPYVRSTKRCNPVGVENVVGRLPRVVRCATNPALSAAIHLGLGYCRGLGVSLNLKRLSESESGSMSESGSKRESEIKIKSKIKIKIKRSPQALLSFCSLVATIFIPAPLAHAQVTNLNLGNLGPGESVTVIYEVTINSALAPTLQGLTNQAAVSGTGITTVNSDDPKTGTLNDPTVTLLVQAPSVTTFAATGVTADSGTLNAAVNGRGDFIGVYFEYGTNIATPSFTPTNFYSASYSTGFVSIAVSGLIPNAVYQFRAVVTNSMGTNMGAYLSLTTTVFAVTSQPLSTGACVGSTASFSVSVNAPGSASYQWQRRAPGTGSFNNIGGATSASYTTPAVTAADDGAGYRVIVSSPGTNITSSEALLSVIALSSPLVTYDFNSGLAPNTAIYGNAAVSSGVLELTPAAQGQLGGFLTADLAPGRVVRGFTAAFKVRIANGSGTPADGFSFNWATDLPNNVTGEEGTGSGLTVSFDTYDNGFSEAPAIDVKWNSNVVSHVPVPLSFISDYSGNFRNVAIRLNADGTVEVNYNCNAVVTRFFIPGYAPQVGARFLLGARTGGEFETHGIDDLAIQLDVDPTNGVPRILGISNAPPSNVIVFGTGGGDPNVSLQASTNLLGWFYRASVAVDNAGKFAYTDGTSGAFARFYRLSAFAPYLPTNLIAYWRAENNYVDSYGNNNGSALSNAPTFVPGQKGAAWFFNGTNSGLSTPGNAVGVPWTACFWVKRQDATNASAALLADPVSGLKLEQAGGLRRVGFTLFGVADYSFNYVAPTNVWTHLAFVAGSGGTILYTNGVAAETNAATVSLPLGFIGTRHNGSDRLQGALDETALFNRALSAGEIQQVINATRGP